MAWFVLDSSIIVLNSNLYGKDIKKDYGINVIYDNILEVNSMFRGISKDDDRYTLDYDYSVDEYLENISDKLVCYRYGLYNGKYIKEAKRRNLNCKSKNEENINSSDKITNRTEKAEKKCKELGFIPATENYGNCVLKLMD